MSTAAQRFVVRHRLTLVNRTKGVILGILAYEADDAGHARMTQREILHRMACSMRTVKGSFASMKQEANGGPFVKKAKGRGWIIIGVATHDPWTCGDDECRAEARAAGPDTESPEDRKRRKEAERARRYRARKRAAQSV